MKNWSWKSIETFLLGAFIVRLYGIWFPPLETWHSWRQTLTAMIARNMNEHGFTLLYPMVDVGGDRTGIIGSEFPFFQFLIAGCNQLFGYDHWYGRLINLIITTIGLWCFYKIISSIFNQRTAAYATILLTCSIWFAFSRKVMPDTLALSILFIGYYFGYQFILTRKWKFWLVAVLFIALGGLVKIPAVYLYAIVLPIFFNRKFAFSTRLFIAIGMAIASMMVGWWYFMWVPHLVKTYGFELFFSKGLLEGWLEIKPLLGEALKQFYFGGMRGYIWILPFILGIIWLISSRKKSIGLTLLLLTLIFCLFALKTGAVFPTHNYYIIPFVPVLALIAAIGAQQFPPKWGWIIVGLMAIEGIANQLSDFRIKDEVRYKLTLEQQINRIIPTKTEHIVVMYGPNPEPMYWLHRKGWSIDAVELSNPMVISRIKASNTRFLIVIDTDQKIYIPFSKWKQTKDCSIYLVN